ncbi:beta-glucosidase [Paraliobacillus quinghaiensis]|uniref:beta-glucosidase n=1 Tax=Paraliobacillus quinghaiensis TaxID=470815 RepID=A0A917TX76_9BACI|nr:glycoside hydrolase family 3 protein [Paraliobacillus quinghaiensis]GGM41054.1 beta-glucosidase [Paraliobacillus quinghaiensis]
MNKRIVGVLLVLFLILTGCNVETNEESEENTDEQRGKIVIETHEDIDKAIKKMTVEEKAGQLIQAELSGIKLSEITDFNIGSILSGGGSVPADNTPEGWVKVYNEMQSAARESSSGIPIIYGIDAVHGNNNVKNATIFPHNIGLGAANNPELMEAIGAATAREVKAVGVDWNFAPAVSSAQDIRWGRTYESYSEDIKKVSELAVPYINGLQGEGVLATTKHFIGDGYTTFGTGEDSNLIDRGDVTVSREKLLEGNLPAYEAAINADTKSIMATFNSIDGKKVHGDKEILTDLLREELGFDGLVVSDWEAIHTIAPTLTKQVALAINSGIDLLMQPFNWRDVYFAILDNVESGEISEERLNEAVRRNLVLKFEAGLFNGEVEKTPGEIGTERNKEIARQAVAESMVLLKNDNILPLEKSAKIYLTGPASDNVGVQSGGWTSSWQGEMDPDLYDGISLKDAISEVLSNNGGELVDNPDEADIIVLAIGENPYTEMEGDTADLSVDGPLSLNGNVEAINEAKESGKPIVTVMIAGRPLLVDDYLADWNGFVMAWLPGTQGNGMTDVLFGDKAFTGTLPVTWPKVNEQASDTMNMDNYEAIDHQFKYGDGLTNNPQ